MAQKPFGVGDKKESREASGVAKKPGGDHQGVHREVESLQGIDIPGVAELPRGDKTPGVTTKGKEVLGWDGRGRGGDKTSPTTQVTKERGAGGGE